jgi:hypothetical protein
VTTDVEYLRSLVAGADVGVLGNLEIPDDIFPIEREGWPDEW